MHCRLFTVGVALALALAGCASPYKKSDETRAANKKDHSKDHSFQAFVGRLRQAARMKDFEMLAGMMTPDFGYRWETPAEGETVFSYWNENDIWPQLNEVLRQDFAPNGEYMVGPPAFAANPEGYPGYRAGMKVINGSWRFVYFVPAPSAGEQAFSQ